LTLLQKRRPGRKKASKHTFELIGTDEKTIQSLLIQIEEKTGKKIGGFIFSENPANDQPITDLLASNDRLAIEQIFFLAKHLQTRLVKAAKEKAAYFLVTTRNDGYLGTGIKSHFSITSSGLTGLVKSLSYEWPAVFCRFIDISAQCDESTWKTYLINEMSDPNRQIHEVGYNNAKNRLIKSLKLLEAEAITAKSTLSKDSVVLVTGGARGITAKCIERLATTYKATYLLVGRTPLTNQPKWTNGETSETALKPLAVSHLKSQGTQPTPVAVNHLIQPLLNQQEIRRNIDHLTRAGSKAEYIPLDITDHVAVKKQIKLIQKRYGKVTALIHGAGNLADKKIDQKTISDFQSVFATKVDGLHCLLSAIDSSELQHLILFSSVSGYFGNAGQADYSAANEVLSGFAQKFQHQFPSCFVRALNWGPWDGGMVNAVLKKAYKERGLVLIPMETGAQIFVDEFTTNATLPSQVVVGGWKYHSDIKPTDLLGAKKTISRELVFNQNPDLKDHKIGTNYVLPATYAIEWLVSQVLSYFPGYYLHSVTQFSILSGIIIKNNDPVTYQVILTRTSEPSAKQPIIQAQINDSRSNKPHYRAQICLSKKATGLTIGKPKNTTAIIEYPLPIYHNRKSGYLFHGPILQGIEKIIAENDFSMVAACQLAKPDHIGQFGQTSQLNPQTLDVCMQIPCLWIRRSKLAGLPLAIGEFKQYDVINYDQPFIVYMDEAKKMMNNINVNLKVCGLDGKIFVEMFDVQFTVIKSLTESENKYLS
jgi:NAD(P)-dependent dehydrogenase (short-subunit alcohol dehydrogenase family)